MDIQTKRSPILLFDTWASAPQNEVTLEIAESLKEQGEQPVIVNIAQHLPFKEWFTDMGLKRQYLIEKRMDRIKKMCTLVDIPFHTDLLIDKIANYTLPENVHTLDDLKEIEVEGFDLGMAIASSLISFTKQVDISMQEYKSLIECIGTSALTSFYSFKAWHAHIKPMQVYFRNGRTALNRPILRYCQQNNIDFRVHERAGLEGRFRYAINTNYIHDLEYALSLVNEHWNNSSHTETEREAIAHEFFEKRFSGKNLSLSFLDAMNTGSLPDGFEAQKNNIVFYTGSVTEYAAIDKKNGLETIFSNQFEAVRAIAIFMQKHPDFQFFVRVHPNTKKSFPQEYQQWMKLSKELAEKAIFIEGDSTVDSYALAKACKKVIVHLSTMGIEAAYLGTPSIVVGRPYYAGLGSNYQPKSEEELFKLLLDDGLPALPKTGTLKYGYFHTTRGVPFKYFEPKNRHVGHYRGVNLAKFEPQNFAEKSSFFIVVQLDRVLRLTNLGKLLFPKLYIG